MTYYATTYPIPKFEKYLLDDRVYSDKGYTCYSCTGSGRIYDPDDPPCSYEGNKLRRTFKCQTCNGSGYGNFEKEYRKLYIVFVEELKSYNRNNRYLNKIKRAALKKLTKEEKRILGL